MSARALLPVEPVPRAARLSAPRVKAVVGHLAETQSGRFPVPSSECRSEVPRARAAASWTAAPTGAWTSERDLGAGRTSLPMPLPQVAMVSEAFFMPACPSSQEAVPQF